VAVLATAACVVVAGVGPLRSAVEDPPPAVSIPEAKAPATADRQGDPLPAGALARLGTTRLRHGANITFVTFGTDGKTLITAGQDNTVRLWDLATGKEVRRFDPPKPAEIKQPPVLPPRALPPAKPVQIEQLKIKLDAEKAQLDAEKARLETVIRQQAKLAEVKPPVKTPAAPGEKGQSDAEKEKARLDAEKAKLAAEQAKLQQALARQRALMLGNVSNFSVAVAPDGKTLAAASANVIQFYEVETGKELQKIEVPTGLAGLLFSPDGRTLAARGGDGGLILWEAATGKEMHRIKGQPQPDNRRFVVATSRGGGEAPGMAFTPDGKALAVAMTEFKEQKSITSSLKIWDVASGKETGEIKGPEGVPMSAVAFAPDGKVLAFGAVNNVHLCEPDTGKELRQIKVPDGVASLVFAPDGKALAVRGRSQQVRLWDTETGKELYQLGETAPVQPGGAVAFVLVASAAPETRNLAFSPDGKRIATASGSTVRLWDAATGKELPLTDGHQGALTAVALSADGKTVVSWGADRTIRRWEAATGKALGSFGVPPGTTSVSLSPDGGTVALANTDSSIRLVETATGKELHKLAGPPNGTGALAFAPDGKVLAARGGDNAIRLYDVARGSELRPITAQAADNPAYGDVAVVKARALLGGNFSTALVFSPDGKLLASPGSSSSVVGVRSAGGVGARGGAGGARGTIDLYDVATGKVVRKIESAQPVASFSFSPDGRVLAAENADQSITLWEVASGKERAHLGKPPVQPAPPTGLVAYRVAVVGGAAGFAAPAGPVALAYSPDGRALVARGPDRSIRVWDVDAGKEVSQLKGHEGRVETLAFAPDGKTIASGSTDTTILLWDAAALMKDLSKPQLVELPAGAAEPLWGDLAGEDAGKALQGVLKLAGAPKQAMPFLSERLKPAVSIDRQKIEGLIADLESEKYAVRQEAAANLVKTGEQVVPALQKVLTSQPTIETRKRVEELLAKLTGGTLTAEQLRLVRAVEALERMGTPEARQLLRTLSQGASGALTTKQAQAALERLAR
jgi:WD40 repeat protein